MVADLSRNKYEVKFHIPTERYGFVEIGGQMAIDEARVLQNTLKLAIETQDTQEKPQVTTSGYAATVDAKQDLQQFTADIITQAVNLAPPSEQITTSVPEPTQTLPTQCKFCASELWDNRENTQNKPNYKAKFKCKNKECGYMYFVESANWWKPIA